MISGVASFPETRGSMKLEDILMLREKSLEIEHSKQDAVALKTDTQHA